MGEAGTAEAAAMKAGTRKVSAKHGAVIGQVEAGDVWCFSARGRWWDWFVPCGPGGYRLFLADALDLYPASTGRPFFELTARVKEYPDRPYPIGRGATVTFDHGGTVELFANDVVGAEWNNWGEIEVAYQPCDCPPPLSDEGFAYEGPPGKWTLLRDTLDKTRGVGATAILTLGAGAALAFSQQGADLVRTVAEGAFCDNAVRQVAFVLMLLFLAVQAWIWPRMIVLSNYGRGREHWKPRHLLNWGPRVLGLAPFVFVIGALFRNPAPNTGLIIFLVLVGLTFFALVIVQYDARQRLLAFLVKRRDPTLPPREPFRIARLWTIASFLISVAAMTWAIVSPVGFGWTLGAPAVAFLGVGCIIPVLVVLVQTGDAARVPALLCLAAAAALFGVWVDNHPVGWRAATTPYHEIMPSQRLSLDEAYALWADQAPPPTNGARTLVLVASEGGASRAGYWTAEVLSSLHDQTKGELRRSLFAISSVSGGSVGAVGYAAVLQDRPDANPETVRAAATSFAGQDFLGPTFGGMLFPDLFQRFLPWALLPDRAQGLELAFEAGWRRQCEETPGCGRTDLLSRGFADLGPAGKTWRPLVIVNGASQESGRRILTSRLRFAPSDLDADDFYGLVGRDVPVSTAIHNGARFPWISPAGTLTREDGTGSGHIVDGGYFEAAGVEVLRELAPALRRAAERRGEKLRIVFIYIGYRERTNDTLAPAAAEQNKSRSNSFLNELTAPLKALFSSRSAHAGHLQRELKLEASGDPEDLNPTLHSSTEDAHYEPILLCKQTAAGRKFAPPMDWALSACARTYMRKAAGGPWDPGRQQNACLKILEQPIPCQDTLDTAIARAARQALGGAPEPRTPAAAKP
ncbi:MAG: hypothetical protein QM608_19315 [Caulobacter sp.]